MGIPLAAVLEGQHCALFASDMHLGDHEPRLATRFLKALDQALSPAGGQAAPSHLFLLGDVFEAWVGDDQPDQSARLLSARLRSLSERGIGVFLMRGNRDFLMGSRSPGWPQLCGAQLLEDAVCVSLFGSPVLIVHGDSLCTDDVGYQQFRAQVRSPQWQAEFLSRPLAERLHLARHMREQSEIKKAARAQASLPMDVNPATVRSLAREAGVRHLIHGHTHRPAHHEVEGLSRWVLPDWHAHEGRGGFLRIDTHGWQMIGHWH